MGMPLFFDFLCFFGYFLMIFGVDHSLTKPAWFQCLIKPTLPYFAHARKLNQPSLSFSIAQTKAGLVCKLKPIHP